MLHKLVIGLDKWIIRWRSHLCGAAVCQLTGNLVQHVIDEVANSDKGWIEGGVSVGGGEGEGEGANCLKMSG